MNQSERRIYLIKSLLAERPEYADVQIPENTDDQRRLLRSLLNVRLPGAVDDEFLEVQDAYFVEENARKGVVTLEDMDELRPGIFLWKGDITRLSVGAIVNAANSGMTGCYQPCHNCIDNCIHTYAGIRLRQKCAELMDAQGFEEPTGRAKLTPAYSLPCEYVIHTVGPIVAGRLTREHEKLLTSCYRSCLELAEQNGIESIAFCCISTGVFMFPNARAAEIAVHTVQEHRKKTGSSIQVVFNVFKDTDEEIYRRLLK
jgi:O-acetyl-ADP-ribose deacetylase (regulator of RNase III)